MTKTLDKGIMLIMKKTLSARFKNKVLPIVVEKDEDGFYVIECPVLPGCYTQGKTLDEALKNIREVIELVLEEKDTQEILRFYNPSEVSLHTITL